MKRVAVCWSGGKDSAWMLHKLRQMPGVEIVRLVTVIDQGSDNVILTLLNRRLIREQAKLIGLPAQEVGVTGRGRFGEYFELPESCLTGMIDGGITHVAFGDLSDQETRDAREADFESSGLDLLFPLWGRDDSELAGELIDGGVKSRVVSIDASRVDPALLGHEFDRRFLQSLPTGVNKCGEFEEFHTFVYNSPEFSRPLRVIAGDRSCRGTTWTIELFPEHS